MTPKNKKALDELGKRRWELFLTVVTGLVSSKAEYLTMNSDSNVRLFAMFETALSITDKALDCYLGIRTLESEEASDVIVVDEKDLKEPEPTDPHGVNLE
tara:strand:- start:273 stop:572 length:300 start_codon:yes stop_codon:yes gene_type:complete